MGSTPQSDRDWEAFRYIAGEMSAAESEAFEARLETDQALREAVAAAVELTQAVAILGVESLQTPPAVHQPCVAIARRRWAYVATVAVTVCLAFVAVYWLPRFDRGEEVAKNDAYVTEDSEHSLAAVAESWTAFRDSQRLQEQMQAAESEDTAHWTEADLETLESESLLAEHSDPPVPAWLLAAAELNALSDQEPKN